MANLSWKIGAIGFWSMASDWEYAFGTAVPGSNDTAVIHSGTISLTAPVYVQSLLQDGSSGASILLAPVGTGLYVAGSASFLGTVDQSGAGITRLNGYSTLGAVGTPATLWLDAGHTLQNAGHFVLAAGQIVLGAVPAGGVGGGSIENLATGTLEISAAGTVIAAGGGLDYVNNTGVLLYNATGTGTIATRVNNAGSLHVASGTLAVLGGLQTSGGGVVLDNGAELDIGSAGMVLTQGIYAGQGILRLSGGTADLSAGILSDPLGTIVLDGGTLLLGTRIATIGTLQQAASAGAVSNVQSNRQLTIGTLSVAGTALHTGTGTTVVQIAASFSATAGGTPAALYLDGGRVLANQGLLELGAGSIVVGASPLGSSLGDGKLRNLTGGTIDLGDGGAVVAGSGTTAFTNSGTIEKLWGSGVATIGASLKNSGRIHVAAGTLKFAAGGTSLARNLTADTGTTLAFSGGMFAASAGTLSLAGGIAVSGGILNLGHVVSIHIDGGLDLSGGTLALGVRNATVASLTTGSTNALTGSGVLTIAGAAVFDGTAVQTGSGVTLLTGSTVLRSTAQIYLDAGRILQNNNNFTAQGGEILLGGSPVGTAFGDGSLSNFGNFLITADGTAIMAVAGYANVSNAGYLAKTAGSGKSTIAANLVNSGTVEVASGTLSLATASGTGLFQIDDGCVLDVAGAVSSGTMQFLGDGGLLTLEAPALFAGTIAGLGGGSTIDLHGFTTAATLAFAASPSGGTLTVTQGAKSASLAFANDLTSHNFIMTADSHGGVRIS